MTRRAPFVAVFLLLLVVGLATRPTASADAPSADGECFPACRTGFVCSPSHQCVSACNPACAAGETCTADGQCVASPAAIAPEAETSEPAVTAHTEDAKDRRLAAPMSWSISAGIGGGHGEGGEYSTLTGPTNNFTFSDRLKHEGPIGTVGFGLRTYFTRVMGGQARVSTMFGTGKGSVFGVLADATLRLGPFGTGFPLFVGGGPFLGVTYISSTFTNIGINNMEFDGSGTGVMGGGVAEAGFLFGAHDRIEIVLRSYIGLGDLSNGKGVTVYPAFTFGYRL